MLNATNEHQKPLELCVIAATFPKVDEPTNDLDVVEFVMTAVIDAIWRRQQVRVCVRPVSVEG